MPKHMVVSPDLKLDWDKYSNIMREINGQLGRGGLTLDHLQAVVEHRNPFEATEERCTHPGLIAPDASLDWANFYREVFGEEHDFSTLKIPVHEGFSRTIIVAKGMTPERLFQKCLERFRTWKWTDQSLDEIVISDRTSKDGAYAVCFRNVVEADANLKLMSANDLKAANIPGITLEERLLMELKYFKETRKHLDIKNVTLCSGSRFSDGVVPGVGWSSYGAEMHVDGFHPDYRYDDLHAREAVS